ncbi:methyltransferase of ATP-grasp peptide maturase system [Actinoalloteichus hoggarensis]|uniref:protein-L-isoaspartate carboxylmethyltransferase n=1 Tax=Actinoalloteichus hoggarensis TaxID=1470176 RepID=UPI0017C3CF3A|nr:protein-L-isoaspartate carboxylmethyltransferase [Actinoalloteichus hoggarensis]MBB5922444.1 methyltransferase of ATP-grasp peptide maturase system [Actinoalloteichus hoggarensis]
MTVPAWPRLADDLVNELVAQGKVAAPEWQAAFRAVPRHEFVSRFYEQRDDRRWQAVTADSDPEHWLTRIYTNRPLVTRLGTLHHGGVGPTSSSSSPALMARMLEALDIHDGHRVCEIGTGTGWNYALLAHRLGAENVFSVDLEDELVEQAAAGLRRVGHEPNLARADGVAGWPGGGPFDRFIATCAVSRIPTAWLEQTRDGGIILADLKIGTSTGNLVRLRRTAHGAEGTFLDGYSAFMLMRGEAHPPVTGYPERDRGRARRRHTAVREERPWESPVWWFLACLSMPSGVRFGYTLHPETGRPDAVSLSCPDGSWCEVALDVSRDGRQVWEGGPAALWSAVERSHEIWTARGRPTWSRLGLTVTGRTHVVWIDDPAGPAWTLHDPHPT